MKLYVNSIIFLSVFCMNAAFVVPAHSAPFRNHCSSHLKRSKSSQSLDKRFEALEKNELKIYRQYQAASVANPEWLDILPESVALEIIEDLDVPVYSALLSDLIEKVHADKSMIALSKKVESYATQLLKQEGFRFEEIRLRLNQWNAQEPNSWYRILGDRTLNEARFRYLGNGVGKKVDPKSLVGQYLAKTNATHRWLRLPVKRGSKRLSEPKLVVSISEATMKEFLKIANTENYMSVLMHAYVMTAGDVVTHSGGSNSRSAIRRPQVGTPLPFLILKSSESVRLQRYLSLASTDEFRGWNHALKVPGMLEGYCATGGYTCCTHWLGNVPIGDKLVDAYKFPGRFELKQGPQIQKLQAYTPKTEAEEKLVQVWKVPGNALLSDVIGQETANLRGDFASPGGVIQTLIGSTSSDRVPVIFWVREDHLEKIPNQPGFIYENAH